MEQDHITDLLPEYLDGQLDSSRKRVVEKHLMLCSQCTAEKEELEILFKAFDEEITVEPSASVGIGFEKMLKNEKQKISEGDKIISINRKKKRGFLRNFLKVAAVVSLLLCSYFLGKFHQSERSTNTITDNSEIEDQHNEMLALLTNTSASKRIKGVSYLEELPHLDKEIIYALRDRMLNDENSNVRLTAVEALGKWTDSEVVKESLIRALKTEKDPVIQIAIIQILVQIQEKKAVEPLQNLLKNKNTEPFVKEQIEALLPSIT